MTSGVKPFKGVLFVVAALGLWYMFALLAETVVIAVMSVPACLRANHGAMCVLPWRYVDITAAGMPRTVLVISLIAALWAASRWVYPPEDFNRESPRTAG